MWPWYKNIICIYTTAFWKTKTKKNRLDDSYVFIIFIFRRWCKVPFSKNSWKRILLTFVTRDRQIFYIENILDNFWKENLKESKIWNNLKWTILLTSANNIKTEKYSFLILSWLIQNIRYIFYNFNNNNNNFNKFFVNMHKIKILKWYQISYSQLYIYF